MPLYEYQCESCDHRFEKIIQKFSDAPPAACPVCASGPIRKLPSSPAIQFKGSGWYITDYAKKPSTDGGQSDASEKSDKSAQSDKSATAEKTEKSDKAEKSDKSEKAAKSEKSDKSDKSEKSQKADSASSGKADGGSSSGGDSSTAPSTPKTS